MSSADEFVGLLAAVKSGAQALRKQLLPAAEALSVRNLRLPSDDMWISRIID